MQPTAEAAWEVLDTVPDPEVPALSVRDLGIVRDVVSAENGTEVVLTPNYSGCPATEVIYESVRQALPDAGVDPVRVTVRPAPAWPPDRTSQSGRRKQAVYA